MTGIAAYKVLLFSHIYTFHDDFFFKLGTFLLPNQKIEITKSFSVNIQDV